MAKFIQRHWTMVMGFAGAVFAIPSGASAQDAAISFAEVERTATVAISVSDDSDLLLSIDRDDLKDLDALFAQAEATTLVGSALPEETPQPGSDTSEHREPMVSKGEAIRLEVIFQAFNALDWVLTKNCLDRGTCVEKNFLWGEQPDMTKMALAKIAFGAVHAAYVAWLFENKPYAVKPVQYMSIALMGGVVAWNAQFSF